MAALMRFECFLPRRPCPIAKGAMNWVTTSQRIERSATFIHCKFSRFLRGTVSFWLVVLVIWSESVAGDICSSPASPFTNSTIPTDG